MTISNPDNVVSYLGNGATTIFSYTFFMPGTSAVRVYLLDVATNVLSLLSPSDYIITGVGVDGGGNVTYPLGVNPPITSANRLVIQREVEYEQQLDLTNQSQFFPEDLEKQLDLIVMQVQQLAEESSRTIKTVLGSTISPDDLVAQLLDTANQAAISAAAAQAAAVSAAASASAINFPDPPVALTFVRRNAANTGYEGRTPTNVLADVKAVSYGAQTLIAAEQNQARTNIKAAGKVKKTHIVASGNFTPDANMLYCEIECIGGGGGGGGVAPNAASTDQNSGGGGGGGAFARKVLSAAALQPYLVAGNLPVVIGAAGAASAAGNAAGGNGGDTYVGTLPSTVPCLAKGGIGGAGTPAGSTGAGGTGGLASSSIGDFVIDGYFGASALYNGGAALLIGRFKSGGDAPLGYGPGGATAGGSGGGGNGLGYGSGGGGAHNYGVGANYAGGFGRSGLVIITEYCSE